MKKLDRYIGTTISTSALVVLVVLLALFSFVSFVNELDTVGQGRYDLAKAAQFVVLTIPTLAYQLFPLVALLGTMLGLGLLAQNNELIAIRAAGISLGRISLSVMKVGILFAALAIVIGEWLAPEGEQYAQNLRAAALDDRITLKTRSGFWARDGQRFVNIRDILPGGHLRDIYIYDFDDKLRMRMLIHAASGSYQGSFWILKNVVRTIIAADHIVSQKKPQMVWTSVIDPDVVDVVAVKPEKLSTLGLYKYIHYLRDSELQTSRYELALWSKIISPFATAVMVFIAIPFAFSSPRSTSIGQHIFIGVLIGIGFYLFNQIFNYGGIVYSFNPLLSAVLPTLIFFGLALYLMRRTF